MKTKLIFLTHLFVLLGCSLSYSQNVATSSEKQSVFSRFIYNEKVAIKLNYFGELGLHPGLEIGTDYTLSKRKWMTVHWDTGLGGYWHRWNHTALFAKTSIGARFTISSFFVDLNAGAGYMHSFLAGDVYQADPSGGLERASNWGTSHFMPTFSLLLGWDGTRKKERPWMIHIGPEIYYQSNFNHIFLPHIAAKIGITYKFKNN